MNSLDYYTHQRNIWSEDETENLLNEYNINELTISEIGDIHFRTPGSISYKLKSLGIITHNTAARGYEAYKNSNLYKEIVENGRVNDRKKPYQQSKDLLPNININIPHIADIAELQNDIKKIKNNIKFMNNNILEILKIVDVLVPK
jgi:hypothetical protein